MTYILVEAKEDVIFITYILDNILNKKGLYEINHNGRNDNEGSHGITESRLENIRKHLANKSNVVIINDADNDFSNRKKELEDKMKNNNIQGNIFLFPNNKDNGILEDLLLKCIPQGHKIPNCFDEFIKCLEGLKDEYNIILPPTKTKVYSYVDVQKEDSDNYKRKTDGTYFYRKNNIWNFDCEAIQPLLEFLDKNVK